MHDAPSFLFITIQIGSFSLCCDNSRISLIYVFPVSNNSSCKLIKPSNQPAHTFFCQFCTHLFYIEGNGQEGKVHEDLVLSKMPEAFVVHVVFNLSEHGFRFYASLPSVFQTFPEAEQLFSFPLVFPKSVIQFYRPVPFALKQRHLRGQPSHLTALYRAFSLTYPDAVFTCLVPILRILCPIGQMQKSCSSLQQKFSALNGSGLNLGRCFMWKQLYFTQASISFPDMKRQFSSEP